MSPGEIQVSSGIYVGVLGRVVVSYQSTDSSDLIGDSHQGVSVVVGGVAAEAVEVAVDPAGSRKIRLPSLDAGEQFEM